MESLQDKIARLKGKFQAERPAFSTKQLFLTKNNPQAVIRILPVGEDLFPLVGVHYVNKTDGKFATYLCPSLTAQKSQGFIEDDSCLICKTIAAIDDSKATSRMVAKPRVALKVIHYDTQDSPEGATLAPIDIKYILLTTDVADQLLDYIAENPDIIDWQKGMLLTITKDYSSKYPTYIFDMLKTPVGGLFVMDLTSDGAKEFIKANDIKIEDAVFAATKEDIETIAVGEATDFGPPVETKKEPVNNNVNVGFGGTTTAPDVDTANGKGKTNLDAFKSKLLGYK